MKKNSDILFVFFLIILNFGSVKAQETGDYNVKTARIAATGDGVTDDRNAINNLVNTTLAVKGGEIYFPHTTNQANTDYLIDSNLTLPKNIRLKFAPGARLKVAPGVTVTIENTFEAGRWQIFNLQGTGKVIFGTQLTARPEWWGAEDDAVMTGASPSGTDNTAAFQAALDALQNSGGGTLDVSTKRGFLLGGNAGLNMDGYFNVRIAGNAGMNDYAAGSLNLIFTGHPANLISARSAYNLKFDSVGFYYTDNTFTGNMLFIGTKGGDPGYNLIDNCSFSGRDKVVPSANSGIKLQNAITTVIQRTSFFNTIYGITNEGYANIITVRENMFVYTKSYGIYLTPGAESWNISSNTFEGGNTNGGNKGLTRALKAQGSAWSINFSNNWLGDGAKGAASDDPMVSLTNTYGASIDNNRFANYEKTMAYGIVVDDCLALSIRSNRFEYMPAIKATAINGYSYSSVVEANNYNEPGNDFSGFIGLVHFDGFNNAVSSGLEIVGKGGSDSVGTSVNSIGFGTVQNLTDTSPYAGMNGKYGGGIRMTSGLKGRNDGSMFLTVRSDIPADFSFWNGSEILRMNVAEISAFKPVNFSGGVKIDRTITAAGITGGQTINKMNGRVNLAASAASISVTNSLVTATSSIIAVAQANDAACSVKNVVPAPGSFTINMTARCAAETPVAFWVFN